MLFILGKERIKKYQYEQEGLVQFVIDSVYALAHAIHGLLEDKCKEPFIDCIQHQEMVGEEVLKYIRNVTFTGG